MNADQGRHWNGGSEGTPMVKVVDDGEESNENRRLATRCSMSRAGPVAADAGVSVAG